jgi:hypothetical protein
MQHGKANSRYRLLHGMISISKDNAKHTNLSVICLRYAKTGLSILQNLSMRGSTWPQTCIEAIRDLESALTSPAPQPPTPDRPASPGPVEDRAPDHPTDNSEDPRPAPQYNPSVVFGDSPSINNFPFTHPFMDTGDFESGWNDLWTVADGPWLIEENF